MTEGRTVLHVPLGVSTAAAGPGARAQAPFYNAAMAGSRDLSVLVTRDLAATRPRLQVLDGLGSGGARGLRIALEAEAPEVTLNDWSQAAAELARRNVEANGLQSRVRVEQRDLTALLRSGRWDLIEVDPFGSPIAFVAPAADALRSGGLLGLTATDTAALHGSKPEAGRRRYLGEPPPRDAPGWHEAALRYLVGAAVRLLAHADVGAECVLAHVWGHTLRCVLRCTPGAKRADAALAQVGVASLCVACQGWGLRRDSCPCGAAVPTGPYWLGPLSDPALLARLEALAPTLPLAQPRPVARLLARLAAGSGLGPFSVDIHRASRAVGRLAPPPTASLIEALALQGVRAAPSASDEHSVTSDAPPAVVLTALQSLQPL